MTQEETASRDSDKSKSYPKDKDDTGRPKKIKDGPLTKVRKIFFIN